MRTRAAILAVLAVVAVSVVGTACTDGDGASATAPAVTTATMATTTEGPATGPSVRPLPAAVAGYAVAPVGLRSYRLSLVFRLRNTILNGVRGPASDYAIATAAAKRGGRTALLIGVAATEGASPPDIPQDILRLIVIAPTTRERVEGVPVSLVRGPEYSLGIVDGGPRHAVVAIAATPLEVLALARAVARSIARG